MTRCSALFLTSIALTLVIGLFGGHEFGLRVNMSASMPVGLWRVTEPSSKLARGMVVLFCISDGPLAIMALERGYVAPGVCSSRTQPILKPVAAVANDIVTISADGIAINGVLEPHSVALKQDPAGRPLPALSPGPYHVASDEVWVLSGNTPVSFDSRYYAAVSSSSIKGIAHPLLVWHE